jgi:hypothetical protein
VSRGMHCPKRLTNGGVEDRLLHLVFLFFGRDFPPLPSSWLDSWRYRAFFVAWMRLARSCRAGTSYRRPRTQKIILPSPWPGCVRVAVSRGVLVGVIMPLSPGPFREGHRCHGPP